MNENRTVNSLKHFIKTAVKNDPKLQAALERRKTRLEYTVDEKALILSRSDGWNWQQLFKEAHRRDMLVDKPKTSETLDPLAKKFRADEALQADPRFQALQKQLSNELAAKAAEQGPTARAAGTTPGSKIDKYSADEVDYLMRWITTNKKAVFGLLDLAQAKKQGLLLGRAKSNVQRKIVALKHKHSKPNTDAKRKIGNERLLSDQPAGAEIVDTTGLAEAVGREDPLSNPGKRQS